MYNGAPLSSQFGEFDPNNADIVNALNGSQPMFSGQNPQTQALMSAISGQLPQPGRDTGGWSTLDAMSGYGDTEPTQAPLARRPWGMLTPEQGRVEVAGALPGYARTAVAREVEAKEARARPAEAPALSYMGMPLISAQEAKDAAERELAAAQAKKAHAEAQLAGEAALPTTTPLRNAAENAFQAAGASYAAVPKFAGYIGGWLANEAGSEVPPTDNAVFHLGDAADKWSKAAFPGDPERADEFGTKAAHLTGFLATLYGAGGVKAMTEGGPELAAKIGTAVTKGSQAALAVGTGGMGQFEAATAAMEAGEGRHPMPGVTITPQGLPVSERDRALATLLGAGVGLTSLIPMASATATAGEREIGAVMAKALEGSGVNAGQMAAFNVLNNAIAREIYDPERSLAQGMNEDVALGALAGGVAHGLAAATGPKRLSTPEEIQAFIDAARRHDTDPAKAAYWQNMRRWADDTLLLPAPNAGAPGAAPPTPIPAPVAPNAPNVAPAEEAPREVETSAAPEPVKLGEAGPYALRDATNWREEAHGDRPPAGRGESAQNIGASEEVGPPRDRAVLPSEGGKALGPRPVVGTETFGYRDKDGSPVVGAINNEKPATDYRGRLVFRAYPEGTTIQRNESPARKLGEPLAKVTLNQHPDGSWEVGMMETHPDQGGRHLTGNMLNAIEDRLGQKLKAPGTFWPDGYRLWSKRDPEAVQHHQEVDGEHLSPATIKRRIDKNQEDMTAADPIRDWEYISDLQKENKRLTAAFERVPEHARTPEALAGQFALRGVHATEADFDRFDPEKSGSRFNLNFWGNGVYMTPLEHAQELGKAGEAGTYYGEAAPGPGAKHYLLSLDAKKPFVIDHALDELGDVHSAKADWGSLKPHGWEHEMPPVMAWRDPKALESARAAIPDAARRDAREAEQARDAAIDQMWALDPRHGTPPEDIAEAKQKVDDLSQKAFEARRKAHPPAVLAEKFTQALKSAGYDSVIVKQNGKPYEMLAVEPGTVTAAHGGEEMYALRGFYRPDLAAARNFPQDRATAGQWVAGLTKTPGAKRWLDLIGFNDWANQQKGSISRDDVLTFMRMNDVHVTERQLGEGGEEYKDIVEKLNRIKMEKAQSPTSQRRNELVSQEQDLREKLQEVSDAFRNASIPGGVNYREMLIEVPELKRQGWTSPHFEGQDVIHLRADDRTMPNGDLVLFLHELQSDLHQAGRKHGYRQDIDKIMSDKTDEYEKAMAEWEARQSEWKPLERKLTKAIDLVSGKLYYDGRWIDLSNQSREITSTIGQLDPSSTEDVKWVLQRGDTLPGAFLPYYDVVKSLLTPEEIYSYQDLVNKEIRHESDAEPRRPDRDTVLEEVEHMPPEAPFKGNWWSELGIKYLIQRAVADGYDAFALPRADQIEPRVLAEPGSLKKFYDENLPRFVEKYVKNLGGKVEDVPSKYLSNLTEYKTDKELVGDVLDDLRRNPRDLSLSEVREIVSAIRYFSGNTLEDTLGSLSERVRDRILKDAEERGKPKTNKIVRITQEMFEKILGKGQAMALTPERVAKMMETSLNAGKPVNVSTSAINQVHEAIAPMRHVVPDDTGVHVLSRIEPQKDGTLLATFTDRDGKPFQLVADAFSDLSNLRGLSAEDGAKIVIANFGSGQRAHEAFPAGAREIGADDPHMGVFFHEGVHSLYRRGLIPADDWSRLAQHAASLNLMDMPIGQYLTSIGEKINAGADVPLRVIYENAYRDLSANEACGLIEEEEPVAHMMELFHHGHFAGSEMRPIADLLHKFMSGGYAKPSVKAESGQSLEDIQGELEKGIKGLYASEFPKKDVEDWGTHGWWALGEGKNTYGDQDVLNRVKERFPDLVDKYGKAYKSRREARIKGILGEVAE